MTTEGNAPWTVLRLLEWTKDYFTRSQVDGPRLCAEVLLAHVLSCKRIELYARYDYVPPEAQLAQYRDLVRRAGRHEPVAYLVGEKEFYSLRFKVTPDVLIPRPETEVLVEQALAHLKTLGRGGTLWDICTGSGCIAIAAAKQRDDLRALGTDVSAPAIGVARANAAAHALEDRVRFEVSDLVTLPESCADLTPFDVITSNPPYVGDNEPIGESVKHEPDLALRGGPEGLDKITPLLEDAVGFLRPGGLLVMEFGYLQADDVYDLVGEIDGYAAPKILRDHQNIDRVLVVHRKD